MKLDKLQKQYLKNQKYVIAELLKAQIQVYAETLEKLKIDQNSVEKEILGDFLFLDDFSLSKFEKTLDKARKTSSTRTETTDNPFSEQ